MNVASGIQLHDIEDVEGFVIDCLNRSAIQFDRDEREDLIAEGVCLLYELARRYEPKRAGHTKAGRFSGFASQFLPRRLGDAWHARNPHHVRAPDETGKRRWQYLERAVSFDAVVAEQGRGHSVHRWAGVDREDRNEEHHILPSTHWSPAKVPVRPEPTASACA